MNWKLLYNYVQGNSSEEEVRKLGVWLQEDPANEDFFTSFIEGWEEKKEEIRLDTDDRVAWEEFKINYSIPGTEIESQSELSKLLYSPGKKPSKKSHRKKSKAVYLSYTVAVAIVLLFTLVFVTHQQASIQTSEQKTTIQYQEIRTVKGQRSNLKLSDGSIVFLNSSTTLKIPQDYGNETRTLYLDGEAFFEVTHDASNPFVVISDGIYTKDLGTQFNISAYESGRVEVAVKEGLVSIGKMENGNLQREIVEITPNKVGVLKEIGGLTVSDIVNMDKYVGWIEGRLVFQGTPFPEVVRRLERWYDIELEIDLISEGLEQRTLTAIYDNMPMSEVLQVMAISMNLSYEREGRTILLHELESSGTLNET